MSDNARSVIRGSTRTPAAWVRPGHIGYVGPDLGVDAHSPPVAMLTVGLDGPLICTPHAARFAQAVASHRLEPRSASSPPRDGY
ncbi:hypothetical protein [Nocardia salmonicida]|uniref:hypothetical protein n=1 Tax=Nocardia salmonicida TaxID=53431 RepID=UPI0007A39CFF|nr:hypothetical protein [Nocardia salmonicida]